MRLRASRSSIEPGEKNSSAYIGDCYDKVDTTLCSGGAPHLHSQIQTLRLLP